MFLFLGSISGSVFLKNCSYKKLIKSTEESINQSINQAINTSIHQLINQSIIQSTSQSIINQSTTMGWIVSTTT